MYRGVLVTLDGSTLSEAVLPVVADLLAGTETVVTLLTVGEVPEATFRRPRERAQPYLLTSPPAVGPPAVGLPCRAPRYVETKTQAMEREEEALQAYLERKAEGLRARGIEVRTVVEFGNPVERIIEYARCAEIDLVAMATHGHTGLHTLIFGSVAGRVLSSGVRPVILVSRHDAGPRRRPETHPEEQAGTRG